MKETAWRKTVIYRLCACVCYEPGWEREERTNSVKYFRKDFMSRSRNLLVNSMAVSGGQFCEGKKTDRKKSKASCPLALPTHCRKLAISCRT